MDYFYFIFLPITVGIGGVMVFLFNRRWHQLHDRIHLALLVCSIITVYITIRSIVVGTDDYAYLVLDSIETLTGLSVCPLFFIYMNIIDHDAKWHNWFWWLFVPAIVLSIVVTSLSFYIGWDKILEARQNSYTILTPDSLNTVEKWYSFLNITVFNAVLELMAVVLIGLSIYNLARYHKRAEDNFANFEESSFSSMNQFLFFGMLFLAIILFITFFINDFYASGKGVHLVISFSLSLIAWIMLYNAYNIRMTEQYNEFMKPVVEDAETDDDILGQRIANWESRKDKPFCKEGLTLVELSRELGVSRQSLSAYINIRKEMNFNQWINTLRINEAKKLLRVSKDLKIGYISDICGFGTQAAFSKIFRRIEGCTPQSYRNSME